MLMKRSKTHCDCVARINPKILKWAREALNLSIDEVIYQLKIPSVTSEVLLSWERGEDFPRVRVAKKLAKLYGLSFIIFYLNDIPQKIKPLKDFRGVGALPFSRNFIFLMRDIQGKQELLKELRLQEHRAAIPFVKSVKYSEQVPGLIRALSKIISSQVKLKKQADKNIRLLTLLFESLGISVSFSNSFNGHYLYAVSPKEVRGFAIADPIAPFIFVNSKDSDTAQLFTLLHEFCHILLGQTGIGDQSNREDNSIETLCNRATAEFLIPTDQFEKIWRTIRSKELEEQVSILTKHFPVSSLSILIKLFSTDKIPYTVFETAYAKHKEAFEQILQEKKERKRSQSTSGFVPLDILLFRKNGKNFTYAVLDGLQKGHIGFLDACSALGITNRNKFDVYINKWSRHL